MNEVLTSQQAAEYLKLSYSYLSNMRQGNHTHEGPLWYYGKSGWKNTKTVFYKREDLDAWLAGHRFRRDIPKYDRKNYRKKKKIVASLWDSVYIV